MNHLSINICVNQKKQLSTAVANGLTDQLTLGVIVTISLFFLGFLLNNGYNRYKELKRLQNLRLYINVAFENLLLVIDKQYKYFRDFSIILKTKQDHKFYTLNTVIGFHTKNVSFIKRDDVFSAFAIEQNGDLEKKSKAFAVLYDQIEVIDSMAASHERDLMEFITILNKHQYEFDDSIANIKKIFMREVLSHAKKGNTDLTNSPLLMKMDEIFSDWEKSTDYLSVYVKKELIIDKLMPIIKGKNISEFLFELEDLVMSGTLSYRNYEVNRERFLQIFKTYTLNLARARVKTKRELCFFNNLKPKRIFFLPVETAELKSFKEKWAKNRI